VIEVYSAEFIGTPCGLQNNIKHIALHKVYPRKYFILEQLLKMVDFASSKYFKKHFFLEVFKV